MENKKYKVFATLHSEAKTACVWNREGHKNRLIKIKYNSRSTVVSNRRIDKNFEKIYNQRTTYTLTDNAIIIDEYYRIKLGNLDTQKEYSFEIEPVKYCDIYSNLKYLNQHPDDVVRITYYFTWFGIASGIINTIISFLIQ